MIALKFDRHLGSSTAEVLVKFQSDTINFNYQSHGFETSQDLTIRRLMWYWNGALAERERYTSGWNITGVPGYTIIASTLWGRDRMAAIFQTTYSNIWINVMNENAHIYIKISVKFVPRCPIKKIPALVQIMAWLMCKFTDAYMRHSASMT